MRGCRASGGIDEGGEAAKEGSWQEVRTLLPRLQFQALTVMAMHIERPNWKFHHADCHVSTSLELLLITR